MIKNDAIRATVLSCVILGIILVSTSASGAVQVYDLAAGDFDNDGKDELVVNDGKQHLIVLYKYNNGEAGLKRKRTFRMPTDTSGVQTGLFTPDRNLDIVTSSNSGIILIAGKGNLNFKSSNTLNFKGLIGKKLEVGDLNDDSQSDLVSEKLTVFVSDKKIAFHAKSNLQVDGRVGTPLLEDINEDGRCDLIVPVENVMPWGAKDEIKLYRGKGDGTFENRKTYIVRGYGVSLVESGEFNSDGFVDLVVGATSSHDITVLFGDEEFRLRKRRAVELPRRKPEFPVYSLGIADFNSDSQTDLAVGSRNCVFMFFGKGDGTFLEPRQVAVGGKPHEIAIGDFNGDGHLDFATANLSTDDVSVVVGKGDGTFQKQERYAIESSKR